MTRSRRNDRYTVSSKALARYRLHIWRCDAHNPVKSLYYPGFRLTVARRPLPAGLGPRTQTHSIPTGFRLVRLPICLPVNTRSIQLTWRTYSMMSLMMRKLDWLINEHTFSDEWKKMATCVFEHFSGTWGAHRRIIEWTQQWLMDQELRGGKTTIESWVVQPDDSILWASGQIRWVHSVRDF